MTRAADAWAAALVISCGLLALPLIAYAATFAVNIQGFAYSPTPITIRVGDTVRWTNQDAVAHSARFPQMGTAILGQGQSGSLIFTTAGTFGYDCAVHGASMQGTVIVQAATPAPTPPPPPTAPPPPPPTPLPTPVRTAPPTAAPTAPPTAAPTETAMTPTPSASPSPTAAAVETLTVSASPSAVAVQLTPGPDASGGPSAPLLIGAAALAVVALGTVAFLLARRS